MPEDEAQASLLEQNGEAGDIGNMPLIAVGNPSGGSPPSLGNVGGSGVVSGSGGIGGPAGGRRVVVGGSGTRDEPNQVLVLVGDAGGTIEVKYMGACGMHTLRDAWQHRCTNYLFLFTIVACHMYAREAGGDTCRSACRDAYKRKTREERCFLSTLMLCTGQFTTILLPLYSVYGVSKGCSYSFTGRKGICSQMFMSPLMLVRRSFLR